MAVFFAKKLLWTIATMIVSTIAIFFMLEIVPGDPAQVILGVNATEEGLAAVREQLGLNKPLLERYFSWVGGMMRGDFGTSYTYSVPVLELVGERMWVSLPLALLALFLSTIIAIPVGLYAAAKRGSFADSGIMALTQLGIAIPNFWFALLMVYVFAIWLALVPAGGFPGWDTGIWLGIKSLLLPAIALALPQAAIMARITRSALLDVMSEDYIRTARAKGLTANAVLWRHALRNALIPVLTILGLQFAYLLAGTIIIENVFYLPGLGRLVFQAITQRDLIVVESVVVLLVFMVIAVNLAVDLAYAAVDPRLRARAA